MCSNKRDFLNQIESAFNAVKDALERERCQLTCVSRELVRKEGHRHLKTVAHPHTQPVAAF